MAEIKKYKHFKGAVVEVLHIAKDSENLKPVVVYKHLDTGEIWTRYEEEFDGTLIRDGKTFERFTEI